MLSPTQAILTGAGRVAGASSAPTKGAEMKKQIIRMSENFTLAPVIAEQLKNHCPFFFFFEGC
jgi:hypothetical protein